jgi:hypothetical protein
MMIDFNTFFRLRVDVTKVRDNLYELQMEKVDLESTFASTIQKYYFDADQLKQFVEYINEAARDHI